MTININTSMRVFEYRGVLAFSCKRQNSIMSGVFNTASSHVFQFQIVLEQFLESFSNSGERRGGKVCIEEGKALEIFLVNGC